MAKKEKAPITWTIRSANQWDDDSINFALDIEVAEDRAVTVYGCRIAEGRDGAFVSWPSRKGKDGKYYSHAYLQLTDEEQEEIIEEVMNVLAANKKAKKSRK